MPKIGRWILLGCLASVAALKGIPAFLEWQAKKKEREKLEEYLSKFVKIIQTEHKAYWGDTLDYNEAYSFAKGSYIASKEYKVPQELLLSLAIIETGVENMVTDRNLKKFSWGYYSINETNHRWLEEQIKKHDSTANTVNNLKGHRLLLNPDYQHKYAAFFLRHHMNQKKIEAPDSAIYVLKYWNKDPRHNTKVKNKFYNIRDCLNGKEKKK
ncbi:MAG: hypothetical protein ACPLXC_00245 [Candidatus Pacearchaeota archaeon]